MNLRRGNAGADALHVSDTLGMTKIDGIAA